MKKLFRYLEKNDKTHLVFDFDETIAKLILPWDEWFTDVADVIKKEYPLFKGKSYIEVHNLFVKEYGDGALEVIRKLNEKFEMGKVKGIEQNRELISFIKNNPQYVYYLWSSNSKKTLTGFLKHLGIESVFQKIISRDNSKYIKPDPYGFSLIVENNTPKSKYLFIGDSAYDRKAAQTIGIDFFLIDYFNSVF